MKYLKSRKSLKSTEKAKNNLLIMSLSYLMRVLLEPIDFEGV